MNFFDTYTSNTLAGSGNQCFFINENPSRIYKCRILYKVFCGGEYNYSFLFSNIIDSTFADGSFSRKNRILDSWKIHKMQVGITDFCDEYTVKEPEAMYPLTFEGRGEKVVHPGEFFHTDAIKLLPKAGEYICLEISFSGKMIPNHEESIIPSFLYENGTWVPSKRHPFAAMIGCDREVSLRIAFFGDSITQGIGTDVNSYAHWNSIVADTLGTEYSYWNLGLGFGRADDAASDGAWLYKAKQSDVVVVCYGANDILNGYGEENTRKSLNTIVDVLKSCGKKVILQTIPPFDYEGEHIALWKNLNEYIKKELACKVELVFDCAALLGQSSDEPQKAKYGGHPNAQGCKIWGDRLSEELGNIL